MLGRKGQVYPSRAGKKLVSVETIENVNGPFAFGMRDYASFSALP